MFDNLAPGAALAGGVQNWQKFADGGRSELWRSVVIHPHILRAGRHALRSAAAVSLLATTGFSSSGWAFVVASPPPDNVIKLAGESSPGLTTNQTAKKTLDVFCRVAYPETSPVSSHPRLPAEIALSPSDAKNALDVIKQVSNAQNSLCSQNRPAPNTALKAIDKIAAVSPISPHPKIPAKIPREEFIQASTKVRNVYGEVKAGTTQ